MEPYLGIVIEQSLSNPAVARSRMRAERMVGAWKFLLVSAGEDALDDHLRLLQGAMREDEPWYAHYFRGDELIVVYRDALFRATTDRATWGDAVQHGLRLGIPAAQLDFRPRTTADAGSFFAR